MAPVLVSAFTALIICIFLTPVVRRFAISIKALAHKNHRTIHEKLTPKLGGLSIFTAFVFGAAIFALWSQQYDYVAGLFLGGCLVLAAGFIDDVHVLTCYRKLLFQGAAAAVAVLCGFVIEAVPLPGGNILHLGPLAGPITALWIVGLCNAINLIDGLDGLAAGYTVIVALALSIAAGIQGNILLSGFSFVLAAAVLGFLRYNFSPASIFMGDTGSLFIGFTLACLSLKAFTFDNHVTHIEAMFIPFALPFADTFLAITRRVSAGHHPFWADREHIHHRLLDIGLSQATAVICIYFSTAFFCVAGLTMLFLSWQQALFLCVAMFFLSFVVLSHLGCLDFLGNRRLVQIVEVNKKKDRTVPEEVALDSATD